jgi:hypothetical protein
MNFLSPEWREVCVEIDKRVAALDLQNRTNVPESATIHMRGQISALLSLRNWQEETARQPEPEIRFD